MRLARLSPCGDEAGAKASLNRAMRAEHAITNTKKTKDKRIPNAEISNFEMRISDLFVIWCLEFGACVLRAPSRSYMTRNRVI